jgi:hypothetical protein
MIFKYFVKFDEDGEIESLYKSKQDGCKEYIVKLIPINREKELTELGNKSVKAVEEVLRGAKRFHSEISKITRDLRRIKL